MLTIYRRHLAGCKFRHLGRKHRACQCPIWTAGVLHGRKIKQSLDLHSWEAAQKLVREWEAHPEGGAITVKSACEDYISDAIARNLSDSEMRKIRLILGELEKQYGSISLRQLRVDDLRKIREAWKVAPIIPSNFLEGTMALNFEEIKKIRIIEVCARFGIALRYRGDFANGVCKLPTHKQGDKSRTFSVNVAENYWRCFSDSCNAKNQGRKGGDVINLVALLENCSEFQAAEKLATWYGLNGNGKATPHGQVDHTMRGQRKAPENGKPKRFMETIDLWFDELTKRGDQEDEPAFWHRVRNGVKAKLMENWRAGVKAGKEGKA